MPLMPAPDRLFSRPLARFDPGGRRAVAAVRYSFLPHGLTGPKRGNSLVTGGWNPACGKKRARPILL